MLGDGEVERLRDLIEHVDGDCAALPAWWAEPLHSFEDELVVWEDLWSEPGDKLITPSDVAELIAYGFKAESRGRDARAPAANCEHSESYGLTGDIVGWKPLGEAMFSAELAPLPPRTEILPP